MADRADRKDILELLDAALARAPEDRARFLDEVCRGQTQLRQELERLLREEDIERQFLALAGDDTNPGQLRPHPTEIGPYRILQLLGEGGMGVVLLAEDSRLGRRVALKLLPAGLIDDVERRQRFLTEARAASALNHPNVCTVFDVGECPDGRPYLAMEYVEGRTLDSFVGEPALPIRRVVEIGSQIADALAAAHDKGIVHRDIKPSNVKLNERDQVKVLDFGLAKRLWLHDAGPAATRTEVGSADAQESTDLTSSGEVLGTPHYMSPEQALGKKVDHRTDVFSLGVVLYELVTSRRPFQGSNFGELVDKVVHAIPEAMARFNYEVPAELERIIRKCLQKDPALRYQSSRELQIDLEHLMNDLRGSESTASRPADVTAMEEMAASGSDFARDPRGHQFASALEEAAREPCEVLINCAAADDRPLRPGSPGWVSRLRQSLESRIEQLSGEPMRIGAYPVPTGQAELDERVLPIVSQARAMVSVVSPPFVKTEACRRELELYWREVERRGERPSERPPPIFNALKLPVAPGEILPGLAALLSRLVDVRFYEEDAQTGRLKEFGEPFGPEAEQHFFERVYDLAFEICRSLRADRLPATRRAEAGAGRKTVYLAEATSDLTPEREQIRRELLERGYRVLPDTPLPVLAEELERTTGAFLEEADVSVHILGDRYGLVPENGVESFAEVQLRLATEISRPLLRLLWARRDLKPKDARQEAFIRRVRRTADFLKGAELIEGTLHELKEVMMSKLTYEQGSPSRTASQALPLVYLVCDEVDENAAEPLEDFLFERGLEVRTPDFEADEAEFAELHRTHMTECDAVLFFYGRVRKSWVETRLRDLSKAFGYGRSRPFAAQAIYIAPPVDRRKERFKTHAADVLLQKNGFETTAELESFVSRIRESADRGE